MVYCLTAFLERNQNIYLEVSFVDHVYYFQFGFCLSRISQQILECVFFSVYCCQLDDRIDNISTDYRINNPRGKKDLCK